MSEHFNHAKVKTWTELTDSERYHLGFLGRYADDHDMVYKWRYSPMFMFTDLVTEDRPTRLERFACESLMVALSTPERKIAFRALLQAAGYLAKLDGLSVFRDAYDVAQRRVENMLEL